MLLMANGLEMLNVATEQATKDNMGLQKDLEGSRKAHFHHNVMGLTFLCNANLEGLRELYKQKRSRMKGGRP